MNKLKIAWITDSTAYMTEELKNNPDVHVIPLSINFENAAFRDGVDLSTEELYRRINEEKDIPKTSQPAIGEYLELFDQLKETYDAAIAIHVSSHISGTYASCLAATDLSDFPVEVVDSKSMSYAVTTLLYNGIKAVAAGEDIKDVAEKLRKDTVKSENFVLLGSLEQFYKGGRMSGTQYLLGNLLRIKPIIRVNPEGKFELFEKVRSEKRATRRLVSLLKESYDKYNIKQVQIMHGNVLDKALAFKEELLEAFPSLDIIVGEISATIAVHAGEGTVSILWHQED